MPVRTVSQKFIRPKGGKIFKGLWGRPTKTAEFGTSLWLIPYSNNICLFEDKIQKLRYVLVHHFLRKLCNGSKKWRWLNQWWSQIFAFYHRNSWSKLWVTRRENCFSTNKIIQNTRFKKKVRFLQGRQIAYLIYEYFRVTGANDSVGNYADLL